MPDTIKNKTYTLLTLFGDYDSILIPSLQRSYAQGRKTPHANEVRAKFLADIRETLEKENGSLSLDLVYGGCEEQQKKIFILLDGQQRLTTLFLLHCFFAGVSQGDISWMKNENKPKFRYETRDSSSDFCAFLTDDNILYGFSKNSNDNASSIIPVSSFLRDSRKFFWTWQFDPTIQAMLVMFDAIQKEFAGHNREWFAETYNALTDPEQRIIFFDCYELNNTLPSDVQYIRMNQRGLKLTDFENFKASFLGFFKGLSNKPDFFDLDVFSQNLDNKWIDYFWKRNESLAETNASIFDQQIMLLLRVTIEYYYVMTQECRKNSTRTTTDETLKLLSQREVPLTFFALKKDKGLFSDNNDTRLWNILINFRDTMALLLEINKGLYSEFADILKEKINILLDYKTGKDVFTYQEHINFYAIFYYLITNRDRKDDVIKNFLSWNRIISNLTRWSDYSHQYQWVSSLNAVNNFLCSHLIDFASFVRQNPQYPFEGTSGFLQIQWLEEHIKENLRSISETWEKEISQAEAERIFKGQILLILEYAGIFSMNGKDDIQKYHFNPPTEEQLQDFVYYRDAVRDFYGIWGKTVFPQQALAICDIRCTDGKTVYPFCSGQWLFAVDLNRNLKFDNNKPFRDLLKEFLGQLRVYEQDSLQDKIEAYVKEKIGIEDNRERIQKQAYSGFILNKEITGFTGPSLYNRIDHDNVTVFLIPEGKAYLRNDFFEYHLFLLKEELNKQMSESEFPIKINRGSMDYGTMPCIEIGGFKNGDSLKIFYNGEKGYCLKDQAQNETCFNKISDICTAIFNIADIQYAPIAEKTEHFSCTT